MKPVPERPATGPAHLDALDGLRGLAVLIVLASHFSSAGLLPRPALHGVGKSGVYLFFVLSAYLLARNLLRKPPGALRQAWTWLDYALRRVLRIWPLYLVVLLASWLAMRSGQPLLYYTIDTPALLRHLTLREGQSVFWSIPVEFTFYLWLPLLVAVLVAMARWRWPTWAQVAAFVTALAAATWHWPPATSIENGVSLGPYLVVFFCGAFAARVDEWVTGRQARLLWGTLAVLAMALWCGVIPVIWCHLRGIPFEATVTGKWYLFFGLLWSVLLLATLHGPALLRRIFAWRGLRWVGWISFSLYLWHMPVMNALARSGISGRLSWAAPVVVLAAALAVAALSWRLFERPLQKMRIRRPG